MKIHWKTNVQFSNDDLEEKQLNDENKTQKLRRKKIWTKPRQQKFIFVVSYRLCIQCINMRMYIEDISLRNFNSIDIINILRSLKLSTSTEKSLHLPFISYKYTWMCEMWAVSIEQVCFDVFFHRISFCYQLNFTFISCCCCIDVFLVFIFIFIWTLSGYHCIEWEWWECTFAHCLKKHLFLRF